MTPLITLPPETLPASHPASSALVVRSNQGSTTIASSISADLTITVVPVPGPATRGTHFPGGIDYAKWAHVVSPSPRDAFADRLDVLDLFDD